MKKFFTLLFVYKALLISSVIAQCDPAFTFTLNVASGTVQFTPVNNTAVVHKWNFGDGNFSNAAAPVHQYAPGTYTVMHVVKAYSTSDSSIRCVDSVERSITIAGPPCTLHAAFSFVRDSVHTNKVYFTNLSQGIHSNTVTQWNFGDGSISFDPNPVHVFPGSGVYRVCLTVRRDNVCASDTCMMVQVQAPTCNITVHFSSQVDTLYPNAIKFTNLSTPLEPSDSITWHFGDGQVSTETNPTHVYQNGGTYQVCLVVKKRSSNAIVCVREFCQTISVASYCTIEPGFVYFRDSTISSFPASYKFFNTTRFLTNDDSCLWDFGDGTPVVVNPSGPFVHLYRQAGIYTVCLTVKKMQPGSYTLVCERRVCLTVIVDTLTTDCNVQANFIKQRDSVLPNKFYFTNLTQGIASGDSVRWNFGDGHHSTELNPVHIYQAPGTYRVCLIVSRVQAPGAAPCADEYCLMVQVEPINPCNIAVSFEDSIVNDTVYFTNQTMPLATTDSIRWEFGDGNSSTAMHPVHVYNHPGTYNVCLKIKKTVSNSTTPCIRVYCKTVTIAEPCNIQVSFTSVRDSLPNGAGATFTFTNTSAGLSTTDSSFWHFGDGTPMVAATASTIQHTFPGAGNYHVCLLVKKQIEGASPSVCVREFCETIVIAPVNNCNLVANFTYHSDSVSGGSSTFYFTNTSFPLSGIDAAYWDFGDSTSLQLAIGSITHTYARPGVYNVCLWIKKLIPGSDSVFCERRVCKTIIVPAQPVACAGLQIGFTWLIDSSNSSVVQFINHTNPITTNIFYHWNFGDGTSSSAFSPRHIYSQPGTYTVCLKAQMANCIKDTCTVLVIHPASNDSCTSSPSFRVSIDATNRRKAYFTNTTGTASFMGNAVWHFGDGTSDTSWHAVHEYTMPGRYRVCLTVTQANRCSRTWCDSVFIPGNVLPPVNCDSFSIGYQYRRDSYMPNKLFFTATSNAPLYHQRWAISRVGDADTILLNQNNPVYVFPDTGLYRVCVKAAFSTNCIKEYCNEIRIVSTGTPAVCMLTAYPNPALHQVCYHVQLGSPGIIASTIFNLQGLPVAHYTQTGSSGNNLVALGIQNLVPGYYTVKILYNGRVCFTRFQKI